MSRKTEQLNEEKEGIYLPAAKDTLQQLLQAWIKKPYVVSPQVREGMVWRSSFLQNLKNNKARNKTIMMQSIRGIGELTREDICHSLTETNNDPLEFLRKAGVNVPAILTLIESFYISNKSIMTLVKRAWSEKERAEDIKVLKRAAAIKEDHSAVLKQIFPRLPFLWNGNSDRLIAKVIACDISKSRKGRYPKIGFADAVRDMMKFSQPDSELLNEKLRFGLTACILLAAFPEWFSSGKDPLRTVKRAYKNKPKDVDLGGNDEESRKRLKVLLASYGLQEP